jgi:hypothetical protein
LTIEAISDSEQGTEFNPAFYKWITTDGHPHSKTVTQVEEANLTQMQKYLRGK